MNLKYFVCNDINKNIVRKKRLYLWLTIKTRNSPLNAGVDTLRYRWNCITAGEVWTAFRLVNSRQDWLAALQWRRTRRALHRTIFYFSYLYTRKGVRAGRSFFTHKMCYETLLVSREADFFQIPTRKHVRRMRKATNDSCSQESTRLGQM